MPINWYSKKPDELIPILSDIQMQRAQTTTVSKYGRLKTRGCQNTTVPTYGGPKIRGSQNVGGLKLRGSQNKEVPKYGGLKIRGSRNTGTEHKGVSDKAIHK